MRWWIWTVVIVAGIGVLTALVAVAASSGHDHTGETVRGSDWADHACGAAGTWEGQIRAIGDDVQLSNVAIRQNDGGSGDSVEGTIYVRGLIDRALEATANTLQEGMKRAGSPDTNQGAQASAVLINWANQTEEDLSRVKRQLGTKPNTTSAAFQSLGAAVASVEQAVANGRAAFAQAAALDPALADAISGSRNCRQLQEEKA